MNLRTMVRGGLLACVLVAVSGAVSPALADSPHFVKASAAGDGAGNLVVSFKEAGLGNNQNIDYTASADATALWGCVNKGGNHPQAQNKEAFSGLVTATGTFSSGRNGQISASLTLTPPGVGQLDCPDDMVVTLLQVTSSNVSISDDTNGITANIAGTFVSTNKSVKF
jgi:hypothetical protein